jgi:CheY-like chemotaxis protein
MPGMDGYEATKHIREIEKNRSRSGEKVCIIAVTANALEGERIRCLEAGMDDYIAKPFDPHFLAEILLKHTFAGG